MVSKIDKQPIPITEIEQSAFCQTDDELASKTLEEEFDSGVRWQKLPVSYMRSSPEELEEKTLEIASTIASKSPYAVERAKKSVKAVAEMKLEKGLKYEQELFIDCFKSDDWKEGIAAFVEKR